jgi:hypothetical protein
MGVWGLNEDPETILAGSPSQSDPIGNRLGVRVRDGGILYIGAMILPWGREVWE